MSATIYKYPLLEVTGQIIQIPSMRKFLCVQMQRGVPTLWVLVNPDSKKTSVSIWRVPTGSMENNDLFMGSYLGTVQDHGFVWHYFVERS